MQKYSYNPDARTGIVIQQLSGIFGLIASTGGALLLFWGIGILEAPTTPNLLQDPRMTLVCVGKWLLVIGWIVSIALINATPTVWAGEDGIEISAFLISKVFIRWSELIDIKGIRFGHYLVRAKRITFFHRIYGWIYSRSLYPSFVIHRDIIERDRLISEMKQHIRMAG